jgi:soluble lytic murein transglycosylase-like protein
MTSFRRKPESSVWRRWAPAFAGATMNWIPAFAGMTRWFAGVTFMLVTGAAHAELAAPAGPDPALRAALLEAIKASDSFEHRFDAEVWLTDMADRMHRYVPKAMPELKERLEFLRLVHSEARRANVPPELVLAVIEIESRFDRFAVSVAGAQGYMQVMPFWLAELNRPYDNLFKAPTNLRMGCTILKFYLDRARGDVVRALQLYNGGSGHPRYSYKVLDALSKRWFRQ